MTVRRDLELLGTQQAAVTLDGPIGRLERDGVPGSGRIADGAVR